MSITSICIIPLTYCQPSSNTFLLLPACRRLVTSWECHSPYFFRLHHQRYSICLQLCICSRHGVPTNCRSFLTPNALTLIVGRAFKGFWEPELIFPHSIVKETRRFIAQAMLLPPEYYDSQFKIFLYDESTMKKKEKFFKSGARPAWGLLRPPVFSPWSPSQKISDCIH